MDGWVVELLAHLGDEHLDLLVAPAEDAGEDGRRIRLGALDLLDKLVLAEFLELGVLGPSANG